MQRPLLEACADGVPRRPYGHVPPRQSRPRPTAKEPKTTEPPQICTADPPTANRRTLSAPTGDTAHAGRGRPRCSTRACHAAVDARRPTSELPLGRSRHDCSGLHRHLETRPHPRHGESAVQVSSQCDVLRNESSTFEVAARHTSLPVIGAHNAEYEFRSARSNAPSSARISAGSGGMVGKPPRPRVPHGPLR